MGSNNTLSVIIFILLSNICHAANSNLFREYIGAESGSVKLSDVPINPKVEFHFILAFAIDYTNDHKPSPTNGNFNVFWDTKHLNPNHIASTKHRHSNVRIALSLGGDSVGKGKALFAPRTISSWVQNAVASLTTLIKQYHVDGIDIDYEHFGPRSDPHTFAECIGQLITRLKNSGTIKFASIAPYEDDGDIERNYKALWRKYGHVIDYVNFQFYAYDRLGVKQFVKRFDEQGSKYGGGQILASFISGGGGGLGPNDGFFEACSELLKRGELGGIFVWCADESPAHGFEYEKKSQALLATIS